MMKTMTFQHGQLLATAQAVLTAYASVRKALDSNNDVAVDAFNVMLEHHVRELIRLADNVLQVRNDWGDPVQLAGLVIYLIDNHRSSALDA